MSKVEIYPLFPIEGYDSGGNPQSFLAAEDHNIVLDGVGEFVIGDSAGVPIVLVDGALLIQFGDPTQNISIAKYGDMTMYAAPGVIHAQFDDASDYIQHGDTARHISTFFKYTDYEETDTITGYFNHKHTGTWQEEMWIYLDSAYSEVHVGSVLNPNDVAEANLNADRGHTSDWGLQLYYNHGGFVGGAQRFQLYIDPSGVSGTPGDNLIYSQGASVMRIEADQHNMTIRTLTSGDVVIEPADDVIVGIDNATARSMDVHADLTIGSVANPRTFDTYGVSTFWDGAFVAFQVDPTTVPLPTVQIGDPGQNAAVVKFGDIEIIDAITFTPKLTFSQSGAGSPELEIYIDPGVEAGAHIHPAGFPPGIADMYIGTQSSGVLYIRTSGANMYMDTVGGNFEFDAGGGIVRFQNIADMRIPADAELYLDGGTNYLRWNSAFTQFEFNNDVQVADLRLSAPNYRVYDCERFEARDNVDFTFDGPSSADSYFFSLGGDMIYMVSGGGRYDFYRVSFPTNDLILTMDSTGVFSQKPFSVPSDTQIFMDDPALSKSLMWDSVAGRFEFNDDLYVAGTVLEDGCYGELYIDEGACPGSVQNIAIGSCAGGYTVITPVTVGEQSNVVGAVGGTMTIGTGGAGRYMVNMNMTLTDDVPGSVVYGSLFVNGARVGKVSCAKVVEIATDLEEMSATGIVNLAVGDVVDFRLTSNVAGVTVSIAYMNLNISRVGA